MSESHTLEQRIELLERTLAHTQRRARRDRRVLIGLSCAAGAAVTIAAMPAPGDVLQISRLEILDDAGNLVLAAGADEQGGRLDVWTSAGQNVLRAAANDNGGDLNLWGNSGSTMFSAYAAPQGGELGLWDAKGARLLTASADGEAGMRLELKEPGGTTMFAARAQASGGGMLVHGPGGTPVISAMSADAAGALRTFNADGRAIFGVEADGLDGGALTLGDGSGKARVLMTSDTKGGSFMLMNGFDQPVVSAGVGDPLGGGMLDVRNDQGTKVLALTANPDGCGRFELANRDGSAMFTVDGVADTGALAAWYGADGRKSLLAGSRPEGGLINVFNRHEVPVLVAGYSTLGLGGAISIKNSRGLPVVHTGADENDRGLITVYDADGERSRSVKVLR